MAQFFRARNYQLLTTNYSLSKPSWLVVSLLLVSALTHFIGLGYPREVIFDEVHFGKFVTAYCCTDERFFDIHPPHAKLLIAGIVKLSGYQGNLSFEHIGQPYGDYSPIPWRAVSAFTGTLLPVIIFGVLRQLGTSWPAAWFGALVVVLDNAITVQTRVIALDGVLLVATFGSLWAYLAAERSLTPQSAGLHQGTSRQWVAWSLLAGALAGLAVGSKFTGLIALGLIGVIGLGRVATSGSGRAVRGCLTMGALIVLSAAFVYTAGWVLHFSLLTKPGSGDAWGVPQFPPPVAVSFLRETAALHITMYNANNNLTTVHHDSSSWWGWPFMNTPIFYWQKAADTASSTSRPRGLVGALYFIGNPVVWVGSTLLLLTAVAWAVLAALREKGRRVLPTSSLLIPFLGYALSFWPLTQVDRGLFLYHYLTPLLFAIIIGVVWLDQRGWFYPEGILKQPWRVYVSLAVMLLFFVLFSPLTFGFLIHPDTQSLLFWSPQWR